MMTCTDTATCEHVLCMDEFVWFLLIIIKRNNHWITEFYLKKIGIKIWHHLTPIFYGKGPSLFVNVIIRWQNNLLLTASCLIGLTAKFCNPWNRENWSIRGKYVYDVIMGSSPWTDSSTSIMQRCLSGIYAWTKENISRYIIGIITLGMHC